MSIARKYPAELIEEARTLNAVGGWVHTEIRQIFANRGVDPLPAANTIKYWLSERPEQTWSGMRDPAARARAARGAPPPALPLSEREALERALFLHRRDVSYAAIAVVMGVYHGHWATASAWHNRCRAGGAPVRWPHRGLKGVAA